MRSTGIRSIEGCFNGLLLVGGVFVRETVRLNVKETIEIETETKRME